jgi:hypothetical protein
MERNPVKSLGTAIAIIVLVLIFGVYSRSPAPQQQQATAWVRSQFAAVPYHVMVHEDLATASDRHDIRSPITAAMWNDQRLGVVFPQICGDSDDRYLNWPRQHKIFCNRHLNIARAHTLVPGETLYMPDESAVPGNLVDIAREQRASRLAILVDGTSKFRERNLQAAVEWMFALGHVNQAPAGVYIYTKTGIFEYTDESSMTRFDAKHAGIVGALAYLNIVPGDKIVLITDGPIPKIRSDKPILGYCMTSACEKSMMDLARKTGGQYIL